MALSSFCKFGTSLLFFRNSTCLSQHVIYICNYNQNLFLSSHVIGCHTYSKRFVPNQRTNSSIPKCSSDSAKEENNKEKTEQDKFKSKKWNLIQRFKESYAIYGKVMLITHGLTSCLWFGSLCTIAYNGFNLLDLFERYNFPDWIKSPLKYGSGTTNIIATACVLYKFVSPLRYLSTLFITRWLVHYMRLKGKAPQMDESNRLTNLAREGAKLSRDRLKFRVDKSKRRAIDFAKRNAKR